MSTNATHARPDPEPMQLLTPEGERIDDPLYPIDLNDDQYRRLYRDLMLVRRVDTEATALQRQGELGLWVPLLGQEAAQVGSAWAAHPDDYIFPSYREHGVAWCRGLDPLHILALFRGTTHGGWDPGETNFHLYTAFVGSQTLHATGYAAGIQRDAAEAAVLTYFGDGATSQGDVNEAFVYASSYNAPVVFFCQNNQWAISVPVERQTRIPIYRRAEGFGFPSLRVDGNDVLAVLAATRQALQTARSGGGPTLIEAYTYRMGAHTTSDDPTRYRPPDELEAWQRKDPIERVRRLLVNQQLADDEFFASIETEGEELATRLRKGCLEMPDPRPASLFDHAYAEDHPPIREEQTRFVEYLDSFAD